MIETTILLDLRTGSICFDKNGNLIRVNNDYGFRQLLDNLFHTVVQSEILAPNWGFDLRNVIRKSHLPGIEMYIQSLVAEALDREIEPTIAEVNYIDVKKSLTEPRRMNIEISVRSVFDNTTTLQIGAQD